MTAEVQAQDFSYTNTNGTITITGYTGPGGAVSIPGIIAGLPVSSIGPFAFEYSTVASVTIPDSVTTIGELAFASCTSLTNATIGNGVSDIGPETFYVCSRLATVTIGASVTNVANAFDGCNLVAVSVNSANAAYSSVDGVLFNKGQTALILYPNGKGGSYTIPGKVKSIADRAFANCSLTSVVLPNSVTMIGDWSFAGCASLASVTLGNSITNIGVASFVKCDSLTSVTIPDSVVDIKNGISTMGAPTAGAFSHCASLTKVIVGKGLTHLGNYAFAGSPLVAVYFRGSAPNLGQEVFDYSPGATVYYLPGTTGWGATFGGLPTSLWNPHEQTSDVSIGVGPNGFGFNIAGTADIPLVIEASTNLTAQSWVLMQSCTLTNGLIYFSDPHGTNYPARFYRIRSP